MKTGFLNGKRRAAFGWLPKLLLALPFVFAAALGGAPPACSATATVSVWNISGPIGFNPNASVADINGLTGRVNTPANPLTIVTVIANSNNPDGSNGLIFWNPVTNAFVDYGIASGFAQGIDINLTAPLLKGPDGGVFGAPTFGPGDTWGGIGRSPRYLSTSRVATTSVCTPAARRVRARWAFWWTSRAV